MQSYTDVNGLEGTGGAFGMGGVTLAGDMVYVTSGFEVYNLALGGSALLNISHVGEIHASFTFP